MKTIAAIAIALATLQGSLAQSVSLPQCGVCHSSLFLLISRDFVWFRQSPSRLVRLRTSHASAPTRRISVKPSTASLRHAPPPTPRTPTNTRHSPAQTPVSLSPASNRFWTPEDPRPRAQLLPLTHLLRRPLPLPPQQPSLPPPPLIPMPLHRIRLPAPLHLRLVIPPPLVQW